MENKDEFLSKEINNMEGTPPGILFNKKQIWDRIQIRQAEKRSNNYKRVALLGIVGAIFSLSIFFYSKQMHKTIMEESHVTLPMARRLTKPNTNEERVFISEPILRSENKNSLKTPLIINPLLKDTSKLVLSPRDNSRVFTEQLISDSSKVGIIKKAPLDAPKQLDEDFRLGTVLPKDFVLDNTAERDLPNDRKSKKNKRRVR